ncbi:MAG: S41 family peptidase [Chloroflexi bacterium]|nr:S41 family peptidase [Chloroflexota bacterium]
MIRRILVAVLTTTVLVVLVAGAFAGGYGSSRALFPPALPPDGGAPPEWKSSIAVFWEAWNYVHQDYYKMPLNGDTLVNGSVGGMVDALGDPHTTFVDAKRAELVRTNMQGSFEGIGATITMREGRLTIVSIIKNSPAERAGLRAEDIILQVDSKVIQNMDVTEAVMLIRGPKGTQVKLHILRAKQDPFIVEITRDTIRTPFVESKMIENTQIAYLRLNEFGATAPNEVSAALRELLAQNPSGLILDLRSNPGGYLPVSIDVASQFLRANQPVLVVKDKKGNADNYRAKSGGLATNIPLVVLIDAGSASASEIVAAALKDHKRATLLGVKTFGKGSVQHVYTLSDQSQLNVTIARFFSPNGSEINDVGVTPDIEVKLTEEDIAAKRDPQLDAAVKLLQK